MVSPSTGANHRQTRGLHPVVNARGGWRNILMPLQRSLRPRRTLILTILLIGSIISISSPPVHAGTYSANLIKNGGFEDGVGIRGLPVYWENATHDCSCRPDPTITVNNTEAILGDAARLDIGQTSIGFMGIWENLTNTFFSNFTDRPDEVDFWFRLDPKYAGLGDFQIKFLAENAQELDYVIDPHVPVLSYPNQAYTTGDLAGQASVEYILLGRTRTDASTPLMAPPCTWVHFRRDVIADWKGPMLFTNNTIACNQASPCMVPGFPLNDVFSRLEFDSIGFQDSAGYHGMTVWIDNVNLYGDSNTPPPPPPPPQFLEFNFTDISSKANLDNYVQWRILNATGYIGPYTRGSQTLPLVNYWLEAYYPTYTSQSPEQYRVSRALLPFDTNTTIHLPMLAEPSIPGAFVAFTPAVLNTTSIQQNSGSLTLDVKVDGDAHYVILAKVPLQPKVILKTVTNQTELYEGISWSYDPSLSIAQLPNIGSAKYTFYFQQPLRIPSSSFTDRTGVNVSNLLNFNITNAHGLPISLGPGQITPDQDYPYYLQAYYQGYRIYRNTLAFNQTAPIVLQMIPVTQGYLIVNSTIAGISITTQSSSTLTFDLSGTGPFLVLVRVPAKPAFVEVNGAKIANWVYDGVNHNVTL